MADANEMQVRIVVDGKEAVATIRLTDEQMRKLGRTTEQAGERSSAAFKGMGESARVYLGNVAADATRALAAEIGRLAKEAASAGPEMESQLADLSAITGIAGEDLKALGDTALEESEKTGRAARDQVEAYKLLASRIDVATMGGIEGLKALGREVVTLSIASGVDLATASQAVAGTLNQFGLAADESTRVVNVLAAGAKMGAAEVDDLSAAMAQAGGTAASAKISLEETVAAIEVMAQASINGSEAGVQFRNIVTILQAETDKLAKYGIKDVDVRANGLAATLAQLTPIMDDAAAMSDIFGRENLNAAGILVKKTLALREMTAAVTDTNTAEEQAAIQAETLRNDLDRLIAVLKRLAVEGYFEVRDELREMVQGLIASAEWLRENWSAVDATARVLGVAAVAVGTFTASVKLGTVNVGLFTAANRAAAIASGALNTAILASRRALQLLRVAIVSNPIGLLATLLTSAAAAFVLFREGASDAADETRRVREETAALNAELAELARLSGAQLFARKLDLDVRLANARTELEGVKESLRAVRAELDAGVGPDRYQEAAQERIDLSKEEARLRREAASLTLSLMRIDAAADGNLGYRAAALEHEIRLMREREGASEAVLEKERELAELREQLSSVPEPPGPDPEEDLEDARKLLLARRELEIEMMEEGRERQAALVELAAEQQIEAYRQRYADAAPEVFAEFEREARETAERIARNIRNALSTPTQVYEAPDDALAPDAELDIKDPDEVIGDGIRKLDGSLAAIRHNLQAVTELYNNAGAEGRAAFGPIIELLQEMEAELLGGEDAWKDYADRITNSLRIAAAAVGDVFGALHEKRMAEIENERSAEMERIDAALANESLSEEQRIALRKRRAAVEAKYRAEEREAQKDAAKREKALRLFEIGINTASAVVEALPNVALAVIVGALGAIQAGIVASTPVPSFAKGVTKFEGGLAKVHAGELLVDLPGGSNVITNENVERLENALGAAPRAVVAAGGAGFSLTPQQIERAVAGGVARAHAGRRVIVDGTQLIEVITYQEELDAYAS